MVIDPCRDCGKPVHHDGATTRPVCEECKQRVVLRVTFADGTEVDQHLIDSLVDHVLEYRMEPEGLAVASAEVWSR